MDNRGHTPVVLSLEVYGKGGDKNIKEGYLSMSDKVPAVILDEFQEAIRAAKYWWERETKDPELRALELAQLYALAIVAGQMAKLLGRIPMDSATRITTARVVDDGLRELRNYSDAVPTAARDGIIKRILKEAR